MSMPNFPETPEITLENAISQIISSIAMEELALSHILNAEGEKLQFVLGTLHDSGPHTPPSIDNILEVNESVKDMLSAVSINQMFLFAKLSAAVNAHNKAKKNGNDNGDVNNGDVNNGGGNGDGNNDENNDGNNNGNNDGNNNDGNENNDGDGGESGTETIPQLEATDGRILKSDLAGDTSDWLEIAKYGKYSLIVRAEYINIYYGSGNYGDPDFQSTEYGGSNDYVSSIPYTKINNWFTGAGVGGTADKLPDDARLRDYTVKNTALSAIGSGPVTAGFNDGFSEPTGEAAPSGADVAFALSYGEAANYISQTYAWDGGAHTASPPPAPSNFSKIIIPSGSQSYDRLWLRSPGNDKDAASVLGNLGRVFQTYIHGLNKEFGLVYPALWVDSEIFETAR